MESSQLCTGEMTMRAAHAGLMPKVCMNPRDEPDTTPVS
jgi:hypothetical protein